MRRDRTDSNLDQIDGMWIHPEDDPEILGFTCTPAARSVGLPSLISAENPMRLSMGIGIEVQWYYLPL